MVEGMGIRTLACKGAGRRRVSAPSGVVGMIRENIGRRRPVYRNGFAVKDRYRVA